MSDTAHGGGEAGRPLWRKSLRRIHAGQLHAFVVPGADVARARGFDLEGAGVRIAATPRHANMLLLIGPLPFPLRRAAVVAWHQMPSPKAVLSIGIDDGAGLPPPDVSIAGAPADLRRGIETAVVALQNAPMFPKRPSRRHEGMQHEGMQHEGMQHEGMQHEGMQHEGMRHEGMQHEGMQHEGMRHEVMRHEVMRHEGMRHEGMRHEGMRHEGGMSMAAMTRSMPRSPDGLAMERMRSHFGPLFSGLPGGLDLAFELDGDSVAEVQLGRGLMRPDTGASDPAALAEVLASAQPLSPVAYRILAWRALESISGEAPAPQVARARIGALEIERAASHLGWLSLLGTLLGDGGLERRAASLQLATVAGATDRALREIRADVSRMTGRLLQSRLFRRRLAGVGGLPHAVAHGTGPVARAAGETTDLRAGDAAYAAFGFEPVLDDGDDALARTSVRLRELDQSLGIALAASDGGFHLASPPVADGNGAAALETPRGAARLSVAVHRGKIRAFSLEAPSQAAAGLVGPLCRGQEVADALVCVASLDLSPWEIPA